MDATESPTPSLDHEVAARISQLEKAPKDVARCRELVRLVTRDAKRLTELRDEHLRALQAEEPASLIGINFAILSAGRTVEEVSPLLEKYEPETPRRGRGTNLRARLSWAVVDADVFARDHAPALMDRRAAVRAELDGLEDFVFKQTMLLPKLNRARIITPREMPLMDPTTDMPPDRPYKLARVATAPSELVPRPRTASMGLALPRIGVSSLEVPPSLLSTKVAQPERSRPAPLDLPSPLSSSSLSSNASPEIVEYTTAQIPRTSPERPLSFNQGPQDTLPQNPLRKNPFRLSQPPRPRPRALSAYTPPAQVELALAELTSSSAQLARGFAGGPKRQRWSALPGGSRVRNFSLPILPTGVSPPARKGAIKSRARAHSHVPMPPSEFVVSSTNQGHQRGQSVGSIATTVSVEQPRRPGSAVSDHFSDHSSGSQDTLVDPATAWVGDLRTMKRAETEPIFLGQKMPDLRTMKRAETEPIFPGQETTTFLPPIVTSATDDPAFSRLFEVPRRKPLPRRASALPLITTSSTLSGGGGDVFQPRVIPHVVVEPGTPAPAAVDVVVVPPSASAEHFQPDALSTEHSATAQNLALLSPERRDEGQGQYQHHRLHHRRSLDSVMARAAQQPPPPRLEDMLEFQRVMDRQAGRGSLTGAVAPARAMAPTTARAADNGRRASVAWVRRSQLFQLDVNPSPMPRYVPYVPYVPGVET